MTDRATFDRDWARADAYNRTSLNDLVRAECERMESYFQDVQTFDALIAASIDALETECADVPSYVFLSKFYLEV